MGSRSREGNMYNFPPGAIFPTRPFPSLYIYSPLIGNKLINPESRGIFFLGGGLAEERHHGETYSSSNFAYPSTTFPL